MAWLWLALPTLPAFVPLEQPGVFVLWVPLVV
jgi:hypothetical protein